MTGDFLDSAFRIFRQCFLAVLGWCVSNALAFSIWLQSSDSVQNIAYLVPSLAERANKHQSTIRGAGTLSALLIFFLAMPLLARARWKQENARSERVSNLERDLEKSRHDLGDLQSQSSVIAENISNLLDGYLVNLCMGRLGFGSREHNTERGTLYWFDTQTSQFVPVARYSANPEFKRPGRVSYPADIGFISEVWKHAWSFDNQFPKAEHSNGLTKQYIQAHQVYGLDEETIKGMKMRSRLYCGVRIDKADRTPLGVLIIESLDEARFTESDMKTLLSSDVSSFLAEFMISLSTYLSLPRIAAESQL